MKRIFTPTIVLTFIFVNSLIAAAPIVSSPVSPFGVAWSFLYGYCGVPAANYSPQLKEVGAGFTKVYPFLESARASEKKV